MPLKSWSSYSIIFMGCERISEGITESIFWKNMADNIGNDIKHSPIWGLDTEAVK
jgi:hypothetical protein